MTNAEMKKKLVELGGMTEEEVKDLRKPELLELMANKFPEQNESTEKEVEVIFGSSYELNAMYKAIAKAHNQNNPHAITKLEAYCADCNEGDFVQWTLRVDELKEIVDVYAESVFDGSVEDVDKWELFRAIYPIWRKIMLGGEKDVKHPTLWFSEHDAVLLLHYDLNTGNTKRGKVATTSTSSEFRRGVEELLGLKMANNGLISKDDYKFIKKYDDNSIKIDELNERLNGSVTESGEKPGIKELLKKAEKLLEELELEFIEIEADGIDEPSLQENKYYIKQLKAKQLEKESAEEEVSKLQQRLLNAQKLLNESIKFSEENEKKYNDKLELIKMAEEVAPKVKIVIDDSNATTNN